MNGQTDKSNHEIVLKKRREMSVSGVKDVDSFDETGAVLMTSEGELTVEGNDIKIGILDTDRGIVTISGRIDAVFYSGDGEDKKRGIVSRFFK